MAHLLIIELPGGNDVDLLEAACARGDRFTFLSADLEHYRRQPAVWAALGNAQRLLDVPGFVAAEVARLVADVHAGQPIDAVLCLIDIRLVEAAQLAQRLGVRHIDPATAALLRDKFSVRRRLAERGIVQPAFALAESNAELQEAVRRLGLPVLVKPADGYGSQNIVVLRTPQDLNPMLSPLEDMLPSRADYGLGVVANDRLLVERYMTGTFYGCDTLSVDGRHRVIGLHEKLMFDPPSFAMRGSTYTPSSMPHPAAATIARFAEDVLDAVGFDHGATHIELMLTAEGPRLIEVNPRLVGARIARLASLTLGRSVHADLIAAHLGQGLCVPDAPPDSVGVIRWIVAPRRGVLEQVRVPPWRDERIRCVEILKRPGDEVMPPFENADRIGYVMVCGRDRRDAEELADRYVAEAMVVLEAPACATVEETALPC
jgi:biotin carboxylase